MLFRSPICWSLFFAKLGKENVLQLDDEQIQEMEKEIESEPEPQPLGPDGQPLSPDAQQTPEVTAEEAPPVDNVSERGSVESDTPELDNVVKRFSRVLNKR